MLPQTESRSDLLRERMRNTPESNTCEPAEEQSQDLLDLPVYQENDISGKKRIPRLCGVN